MDYCQTTRRSPARPRQGGAVVWLLLIVVIAGVGSWFWWRATREAAANAGQHEALLHTIGRDEFSLEITERGEIESAGSTEIRSQVKANNSAGVAILKIVPEGIEVEEGDFLVELDSSALDSERLLQQISVNTVEATVIEAKNLYETTLIAREEYI